MLFVGNGYHPEYALRWAIPIILFGAVLFRPQRMQPIKTDDGDHGFNSLLYSIDLFVPGVNLEFAKAWVPQAKWKWLRAWMHIQKLLGWVVVPIALVALTGIVKP